MANKPTGKKPEHRGPLSYWVSWYKHEGSCTFQRWLPGTSPPGATSSSTMTLWQKRHTWCNCQSCATCSRPGALSGLDLEPQGGGDISQAETNWTKAAKKGRVPGKEETRIHSASFLRDSALKGSTDTTDSAVENWQGRRSGDPCLPLQQVQFLLG